MTLARTFLFVAIISICTQAQAQKYQFAQPLKIQLGISGTFGELRSNHFHSGIDIRTQGRTGQPVYASEKGYIMRIKVSATGYGKAIYINHPNGLTTVYAHLEQFNDTIEQYVANYQHKKELFEVDLYLKPGQITVAKNQCIGYSGNSGSSGGPHLHYEVRITDSQKLLQPINFFPSWGKFDKIEPSIDELYLYQIDSALYLRDSLTKTKLNVVKTDNGYVVADTIYAYGSIGFGVAAHDRINQYCTRCGANGYAIEVNNDKKFAVLLDCFSFTESKHINSLVDFGHLFDTKKRIVRLWKEPNNTLSQIKVFGENSKGIIHTQKDSIYNVLVSIIDSWGNKTSISGVVVGLENEIHPPLPPIQNAYYIHYNKSQTIEDEFIRLQFSANSFYHNVLVNYSSKFDSITGIPTIYILPNRTPLRKNFELGIKSELTKSKKASKMYIGQITDGAIAYKKTAINKGRFTTQTSTFGSYTIHCDTISPKISAKNFNPKKALKSQKWLEFTLTDSTGISKYKGYIDGKWEVFEWDLKTETLKYKLDSRKQTGTTHQVRIVATDMLKNETEYRTSFIW